MIPFDLSHNVIDPTNLKIHKIYSFKTEKNNWLQDV